MPATCARRGRRTGTPGIAKERGATATGKQHKFSCCVYHESRPGHDMLPRGAEPSARGRRSLRRAIALTPRPRTGAAFKPARNLRELCTPSQARLLVCMHAYFGSVEARSSPQPDRQTDWKASTSNIEQASPCSTLPTAATAVPHLPHGARSPSIRRQLRSRRHRESRTPESRRGWLGVRGEPRAHVFCCTGSWERQKTHTWSRGNQAG